jgi:hypothetical protein
VNPEGREAAADAWPGDEAGLAVVVVPDDVVGVGLCTLDQLPLLYVSQPLPEFR